MRRWGQISEPKSNEWYANAAQEVYRPDVWLEAANALLAEGYLTADEIPETDGYKAATGDFIDNVVYDGKDPVGYLTKFKVGLKDQL
jgi:nitrate/nitrite transport system substrate-binding protein